VIFFRWKRRKGRKNPLRDPKTGKFVKKPQPAAAPATEPEPGGRFRLPALIKLPLRRSRPPAEDPAEASVKGSKTPQPVPLERVRGIIWYEQGDPL
jgi:hypothetical protein